jgi:hypothetical protein
MSKELLRTIKFLEDKKDIEGLRNVKTAIDTLVRHNVQEKVWMLTNKKPEEIHEIDEQLTRLEDAGMACINAIDWVNDTQPHSQPRSF